MLEITIEPKEYWDEKNEEIVIYPEKPVTIRLEHSLISITKWEAKYHKSFISTPDKDKTPEEVIDYIRCMTLTQNVPDKVYNFMSKTEIEQIQKYIIDPMTATTINEKNSRPTREILTSEILYYWMIELGIPVDIFEKRHLNQLITLIKVISIKRNSNNKMSKKDIGKQNASLNAMRRAQHNTKG